MMRHLTIVAMIYLSLVFQPCFAADIDLVSFRPWFPGLAMVACVLLTEGALRLVWVGLLALCVDCLSGDRLGLHVIVATLIATALIVIRADSRSASVALTGMLVFSGTFLWQCTAAIAHGFIDRQPFDLEQLVLPALRDGISTVAIALCVLLTGRLLRNAIRPQRTSSLPLTNRWSMLTGG